MQRTESELAERYFARIKGIETRWSLLEEAWAKTTSGRRIIANTDQIKMIIGNLTSYESLISACKALGHWPRRES